MENIPTIELKSEAERTSKLKLQICKDDSVEKVKQATISKKIVKEINSYLLSFKFILVTIK